MGIEDFRYDGKRAMVVGAATGMGAATARLVEDLGAEVIALDVAEISYPVKPFDSTSPTAAASTRRSPRSRATSMRSSAARVSRTERPTSRSSTSSPSDI